MAWTALMTFTANSVLTAAQLNTYIGSGGNLSHTAPAVVTTAGDTVYATAANAIARLAIGTAPGHLVVGTNAPAWRRVDTDYIATSQTTTSTAYTALTTVGPQVSMTTGAFVIYGWSAQLLNSGAAASTYFGVAVSGATTVAADDDRALRNYGDTPLQFSYTTAITTLTPGVNTFTARYRVTSGTGTFENRRLWVISF